tara:strand:- start:513 stop:905 length:393 start_codon:yes stop_codon:yes gene_type:complete
MAFIVGSAGIEANPSVEGNCAYPPLALGAPYISPDVMIEQQPAEFFYNAPEASPGDPVPVPGNKINPLAPPYPSCPVKTRTWIPTLNTTVFINDKLVGVIGDQTIVTGTAPNRVVTGAPRFNRVQIQTRL